MSQKNLKIIMKTYISKNALKLEEKASRLHDEISQKGITIKFKFWNFIELLMTYKASSISKQKCHHTQ